MERREIRGQASPHAPAFRFAPCGLRRATINLAARRNPYAGREQNVEGVRKLVTRKYRCLVCYTVDEATEEVVIASIQHPARARNYAADD
jgi:plasmid stabilization system protein ParE